MSKSKKITKPTIGIIKFLSANAAAERLGLNPSRIRQMCIAGELRGAKKDKAGKWIVPRAVVERLKRIRGIPRAVVEPLAVPKPGSPPKRRKMAAARASRVAPKRSAAKRDGRKPVKPARARETKRTGRRSGK